MKMNATSGESKRQSSRATFQTEVEVDLKKVERLRTMSFGK
jgi:hypothetical protein